MESHEHLFINYYECSQCGYHWIDEYRHTCSDKCPICGIEIEPYESRDIDKEED